MPPTKLTASLTLDRSFFIVSGMSSDPVGVDKLLRCLLSLLPGVLLEVEGS